METNLLYKDYSIFTKTPHIYLNLNTTVTKNLNVSDYTTISKNLTVTNNIIGKSHIIIDKDSTFKNNINILGNINLEDPFYSNNKVVLNYTDDASNSNSGTLVVKGGVGIHKDVCIGGNTTISENLNVYKSIIVDKDSKFKANLDIYGNLTLHGSTFNVVSEKTIIADPLIVFGTNQSTSSIDNSYGGFVISHKDKFSGLIRYPNTDDFYLHKNIPSLTQNEPNLASLSNKANLYTDTINTTNLNTDILHVKVATSLNQDSIINGNMTVSNNFTSSNIISDNIVIHNNALFYANEPVFRNNINIYGNSTIHKNLFVNDSLTVKENTVLNNLNVKENTVLNKLLVNNDVTISKNLNILQNINVTDSVNVAKDLTVSGNVVITGNHMVLITNHLDINDPIITITNTSTNHDRGLLIKNSDKTYSGLIQNDTDKNYYLLDNVPDSHAASIPTTTKSTLILKNINTSSNSIINGTSFISNNDITNKNHVIAIFPNNTDKNIEFYKNIQFHNELVMLSNVNISHNLSVSENINVTDTVTTDKITSNFNVVNELATIHKNLNVLQNVNITDKLTTDFIYVNKLATLHKNLNILQNLNVTDTINTSQFIVPNNISTNLGAFYIKSNGNNSRLRIRLNNKDNVIPFAGDPDFISQLAVSTDLFQFYNVKKNIPIFGNRITGLNDPSYNSFSKYYIIKEYSFFQETRITHIEFYISNSVLNTSNPLSFKVNIYKNGTKVITDKSYSDINIASVVSKSLDTTIIFAENEKVSIQLTLDNTGFEGHEIFTRLYGHTSVNPRVDKLHILSTDTHEMTYPALKVDGGALFLKNIKAPAYDSFTGSHVSTLITPIIYENYYTTFSNNKYIFNAGLIVSVDNSTNINIINPYFNTKLSTVNNDTRVFGVIQKHNNTNVYTINSLGDGAVWVSNINGEINNGDYITSSVIPGYGSKQNDDILHSYTVAKCCTNINWNNINTYIIFNNNSYKITFTACTYHCG